MPPFTATVPRPEINYIGRLSWADFLTDYSSLRELYLSIPRTSAYAGKVEPIEGDLDPQKSWLLEKLGRIARANHVHKQLVQNTITPGILEMTSAEIIEVNIVPTLLKKEVYVRLANRIERQSDDDNEEIQWIKKLGEAAALATPIMHRLVLDVINAENAERTNAPNPKFLTHEELRGIMKSRWHRTGDDGSWMRDDGVLHDEMEHEGALPWDVMHEGDDDMPEDSDDDTVEYHDMYGVEVSKSDTTEQQKRLQWLAAKSPPR